MVSPPARGLGDGRRPLRAGSAAPVPHVAPRAAAAVAGGGGARWRPQAGALRGAHHPRQPRPRSARAPLHRRRYHAGVLGSPVYVLLFFARRCVVHSGSIVQRCDGRGWSKHWRCGGSGRGDSSGSSGGGSGGGSGGSSGGGGESNGGSGGRDQRPAALLPRPRASYDAAGAAINGVDHDQAQLSRR